MDCMDYVTVTTTEQQTQLESLYIEGVHGIAALSFHFLAPDDRTPYMAEPYAPREAVYVKDLMYTCKEVLKGVHIDLEKMTERKLCKRGGTHQNEWVYFLRFDQLSDFTTCPPRKVRILLPKPIAVRPECMPF